MPDENDGLTDVWFAIYGANLNLDADGNVESVVDAGLVRDSYFALCEAERPRPSRRHRRLNVDVASRGASVLGRPGPERLRCRRHETARAARCVATSAAIVAAVIGPA